MVLTSEEEQSCDDCLVFAGISLFAMCCFLVFALCSQCLLGLFLVLPLIPRDNIAPLAWLSNSHCASPELLSTTEQVFFSTRAQPRTLSRGGNARHHQLVYHPIVTTCGDVVLITIKASSNRRAGFIHSKGGQSRGLRGYPRLVHSYVDVRLVFVPSRRHHR